MLNPNHYASVRLYLEAISGWATQSMITHNIGVSGRDMRKLANACPQTFIGSNEGYKLASICSVDELEQVTRVLMSRAEKILHRARSLQRYTLERNRYERNTVANAAIKLRVA